MNKVILITGTSTGLGLKTAILFAKNGYKVYASMRNLDKKEPLLQEAIDNNVTLNVVSLDVTDTQSVENCVNTIIEKEGRIDILVNNAGAGFAKSTEQATEEEIKWVTDVNYMSVVRCTKAVLPQMRQQRSGHIVNITSVGGLVGQPFNELYCAAKFAVEGYTESLATYMSEPFGIQFTAIEPGGIATEFVNSATHKMSENGGIPNDEYLPILHKYLGGMQKRAASGDSKSYQTPEQVAEVVLSVAENLNPPIRIRTSEWAQQFCHLKTETDPDGTKLRNQVINQFLK